MSMNMCGGCGICPDCHDGCKQPALPDRAVSQTVVMDPTDVRWIHAYSPLDTRTTQSSRVADCKHGFNGRPLDPCLQSSRHAHSPIEQWHRLWSWIQRRPLDPCLQSSRHVHCPIEQRRRLWSWIQRTSLDPCLQSSQHAHCPIEQRCLQARLHPNLPLWSLRAALLRTHSPQRTPSCRSVPTSLPVTNRRSSTCRQATRIQDLSAHYSIEPRRRL